MGTSLGSARTKLVAVVARAIEGAIVSQARTTGLRARVGHPNVGATETGFIKLRDDDEGEEEVPGTRASADPDGVGMDMF